MVPRATITIREATVFIGIWTAADSDIVNGFLLIFSNQKATIDTIST
jgi:hypothetical protein